MSWRSTTQAFNLATGLVQSILAGTGNAISNQTFTFDPLGNLTARTWLNGGAGVKENACYDGLNRLTSTLVTSGAACTGAGAITAAYDALGNITQKSDVCATANCFVYGGSGAGPHALTSIVGTYNGVINPSFVYDANGLMTSGAGRTVTATTFDMAASITEGSNSAAFSYDSEHARTKMVITGVNAGTTYYLNDPSGAMEEKAVVSGQTNWRDYILAGGKLVAERLCVGAAPCTASPTVSYFVLDHLGSVAVIVSSTGTILNQLSYDAWGKRRNPDGSAINCVAGTAPPAGVTRGFTGQEMIDALCLVNLNARVYDPTIGRFMAADPTVGDPTVPQELNRYTYVLDNPLSLTDPSGLCFAGCFWKDALFRDVLGLAVTVFLIQPELIALEGGVQGLTAADLVINAGIEGGISGVISTGTLKGAALGALEGGLFAEAGNLLGPKGALSGGFFGIGHAPSEFLLHGLVGGLTSELQGGRFGSGFLAGAISSFAPAPTPGQPIGETVEGAVISAALGGAGAELGGGKFENGAVTGAFGYLFNDLAHPNNKIIANSFDLKRWTYVGEVFDFPGEDKLIVDAGTTIGLAASSVAGPLPTNQFWFDVSAQPINPNGSLQTSVAVRGWSGPSAYSSGFTGNFSTPNLFDLQSLTGNARNQWTISIPSQDEAHDNSMYNSIKVYVPKGTPVQVIRPPGS